MVKKVLCIGGPTGSGKDTIIGQFLARRADFVRVPRATTRPRRPAEVDGVDYFFLTPDEFQRQEDEGKICAVDTFCGYKYGVDVQFILLTLQRGKKVVGVFGVCSFSLRSLLDGKTCLVYVTADREKLSERLIERGHPEVEVIERLAAAERQMAEEPSRFDFFITNNKGVEDAVSCLMRLVDNEF